MTFKQLENNKLGVRIESKCNGKIEQRVVIAHADNANFCTSGENSELKMQEIVSCCMKIHEATGSKVQKDKVFECCWKCKDNLIINFNVDIKLNEEEIKQIMVNESIKTLGVCTNPQT